MYIIIIIKVTLPTFFNLSLDIILFCELYDQLIYNLT